jgi:hypothetical protein
MRQDPRSRLLFQANLLLFQANIIALVLSPPSTPPPKGFGPGFPALPSSPTALLGAGSAPAPPALVGPGAPLRASGGIGKTFPTVENFGTRDVQIRHTVADLPRPCARGETVANKHAPRRQPASPVRAGRNRALAVHTGNRCQ